MEDRWIGDKRDFKKYALLRQLRSHAGVTLGVCWMRPRVATFDYLDDKDGGLAVLDDQVLGSLGGLTAKPDPGAPSLAHVEGSGLLGRPGEVVFFDDTGVGIRYGGKAANRMAYLEAVWKWASAQATAPGILYFDPSTGIGQGSKYHLDLSELSAAQEVAPEYAPTVVVYQHENRDGREKFRLDVMAMTKAAPITGPSFCFFSGDVAFVVLGARDAGLRKAALDLAARWPRSVLGDAVVCP